MNRVWYLILVPIGSLTILAGLALMYPSLALAPALETPYAKPSPLSPVRSLDELYAIRDRLRAQLENSTALSKMVKTGVFSAPTSLMQTLQAVEIRIQIEETAREKMG